MSAIAIGRANPNKMFKLLLVLSVLFFCLVGSAAYFAGRGISEVPLKPCKRCTVSCPCPRLSGAIRCGCPE